MPLAVDRAKLHEDIGNAALKFLDTNLRVRRRSPNLMAARAVVAARLVSVCRSHALKSSGTMRFMRRARIEMKAIAARTRHKVVLRALEDGVQPPLAASARLKDRSTTQQMPGGDEPSVPDRGQSRRRRCRCLSAGLGQPAHLGSRDRFQRRTLEPTIGERVQNRHDTFAGVMLVRGGDIDRQRDTVVVYGNMDLDAPDLLPAVDAAVKTQLGAERQDRLSMTMALSSGVSFHERAARYGAAS